MQTATVERVVTSSVDWCEANYAVLPFVAEFWNTVSSLAIVLSGVVGFFLHRRVADRLILLAFASVAVVGLGSVAFHATLRFEHQMLDELPMVFTATVLLYAIFEPGPARRLGAWFPLCLIGYSAGAAWVTAVTRGESQHQFFQVTFTAMEFYSIYRVYLLQKRSRHPVQRFLFRRGMSLYAAAIVFWTLDFDFCEPLVRTFEKVGLPYVQLHALWHVCVAGGFYYLVLTIAHNRLLVRGKETAVLGGVRLRLLGAPGANAE